MKPLLLLILIVGIGGLGFSGYLSYQELFGQGQAQCTAVGEPGTMLGAPPCIYGFFMYLAISTMAVVGLIRHVRGVS